MKYFDWLGVRGYIFKALPLVYDNSLSYYELLQKLINAVTELYEAVNVTPDFVQSEIERIIQEMYEGGELEEIIAEYIDNEVHPLIDGLRNYQGAYERDSSTAAVHDLDFYYIDRTYSGETRDGTVEHPFNSVDEAFEKTLNVGIACPNFRFLTGGNYSCKYATFNGVTVHMSIYNSTTTPVIHFTAHNNITWYNAHINFKGLDIIIDDTNYLFRGENAEFHLENCSFNRRVDMATGGMHIISCNLKSISLSNSTCVMEGNNIFSPDIQNCIVCRYNSNLTVLGTLIVNASTSGEEYNRAFYVRYNSCLYLATDSVPNINSAISTPVYLHDGSKIILPSDFLDDLTINRDGITTVQTTDQTI